MNATIQDAQVVFLERPFAIPLQLSTGAITTITEARAQVTVRVGDREGMGRGAIYLSDLWAWPDPALSHAERDRRLRAFCVQMAQSLRMWCGDEPQHPLELGLRLHHRACALPNDEVPPVLARAMCASPFDAAIHDAVGQALQRSAFSFYEAVVPLPSADPYFREQSAARAIQRCLLRPPPRALEAWLIVGRNDVLDDVRPWITDRGYRCFKLKIMGKDTATDVARTVEVYRWARALGVAAPRLCVDSNEANPDADSVMSYLLGLRAADPEAYGALLYLEQPTGRDILEHAYDWRPATALKPVLLDEGLTDLGLMATAHTQGWSGFALKTCKGHSFALVAAAWACENGLMLSMQDLTNPGLAAIHAALFAAHTPTVNGLELNAAQFTPDANAEWLPRLAPLLAPADGLHRLPTGPAPAGLGSHW